MIDGWHDDIGLIDYYRSSGATPTHCLGHCSLLLARLTMEATYPPGYTQQEVDRKNKMGRKYHDSFIQRIQEFKKQTGILIE